MSRSRRKTTIVGNTCADSEKSDKRDANRRLRRLTKRQVQDGLEPAILREVSDTWDMAKDGKSFFPNDNRRK